MEKKESIKVENIIQTQCYKLAKKQSKTAQIYINLHRKILMKYLITYDIEDDKKKKKYQMNLETFGYRVNYSVLNAELKPNKTKKTHWKLEELVDKKYDSLRFYHICEKLCAKSFELL